MTIRQRSIAIPEPVNQVDSLWRTTQALKEAVEVLQGDRGNRAAALDIDVTSIVADLQNQIDNLEVTAGSGATQLNELSDVTITSADTGDLLRYSGTAWVDYPDSNYAASTHTHVLADVTDVTATAAELNLLDLSGLTAGWALIADTATTASWQALPSSPQALGDLTDVTITAAATGDILRYNGSAWVDYPDSNYQPAGSYLTDITGESIGDLSDVTITAAATGDILRYSGTAWVDYPDSNYAASSHTHVEADITDLQAYLLNINSESIGDLSDVTITAAATGDILRYSGTAWVDYPDSNYAAASHTHVEADITDLGNYGEIDQTVAVTGTWTLDGTVTTSGFGTGGRVKDGTDTSRPAGFNVLPIYEIDANDSFDLAHNGMLWHKDANAAVTFTCANDSTIPQGATWVVHNDDTEDLTIGGHGVGGVSVYRLIAGGPPTAGNVTVEQGGIVTVYKYSDTEYWVWGDAALGAVVAQLNDLTDVTITAAATGDILRYNGSAWVDYPDSNYAASSHTHVLADVTDVTATAAEVNLLDLSGLTAGWALLADSATTASWQALPTSPQALGDLTDVTITAAATGDILRYNGSAWVDYPDSNYAASSHTHVEADITDLGNYGEIDATVAVTGTWTLDGTVTTSDYGTGGRVKDGTDTAQPVGFNVLPVYEIDANDSFDLAHNGMLWHKDAGVAVTFTCDNDATIPVGATYVVHNDDTENLTIAQGTGVTVLHLIAGGPPAAGNVTVEQGGIVTVYKYTDTEFWVWGDTAPGSVVVALGDLTDVTITAAATGDILRYNGSAWVDYPDSNYAAASHTHTLSDVTDVTATAAEVNLLDLSGLTVGWALLADSATTASWQALPATPQALDDLTDVTITAAATGDILRYNGSAWVDYPDSNYAAASHTHVLANVTDVTATAAEVNLLDLSGLTAGWALLADSATTASWQALPATPQALDDLTDVTITAAATGDILRYNGSAWVDYPDSNYQPAGSYLTDITGESIGDLSDVTITAAATGDILRYSGTAWVDYPDSNYAAASHTHVEADITDLGNYGEIDATVAVTGTWTLDGTVTTSDFGTGGRVKDGTDTSRAVGFNVMPVYEIDANDSFDLAHNGMIWHKDANATVTFTCDNDATIPQGATWVVHNDDTENLTIAQGTGVTVYRLIAGGPPAAGNVTVEQGGIVTVYKYSDTEFWVWGDAAPGSVVAALGDLTDVTITAAATGDILRYNGSAWVDYPDSNYAAASHTHTLSDVTDVTATAAEVNLLDLSGLTAGWALLADSATTASWQALPATPQALDDLTDVTITAAATGDILRYNGSAWVDYPDSNYAASSHTHTLSQVTDVTATAAEVNLLDLSGLTAGWALIADTATTASWQAIPSGASALNDLTDVTLTTPSDGAILIYDVGTAQWRDFLMSGDATMNDSGVVTVTNNSHSHQWSNITATPTTLSGYGISDTQANFNTALSDGSFAFAGGAFHDGFSDFVANEHIDWTSTSSSLNTTGTVHVGDGSISAPGIAFESDPDTGWYLGTAGNMLAAVGSENPLQIRATSNPGDGNTWTNVSRWVSLTSSTGLAFEGGQHSITNNDGGGNFNWRHNCWYNAGDVYVQTGKATHLEWSDSTDNNIANLEINAAVSGTADTALSTNSKFYFYNASSTYGASFRIANGDLVMGTTARVLNNGNANFATLTATTYGGITEANLVDKSATETITGTWTLDGTVTTSDYGTGGRVKDGTDVSRPIGFNVMPVYEIDANDSFDLAHNGMIWHKDANAAVTFTCDNDATIPVGAVWVVHNDDTEDLTIAQGTGVTIAKLQSGGVPATGNVTVEQGGIVTVYKYTDTEFWVWGDAAPGSTVLALDDLTDVTITAAATGDILRYNGSAWVDYPDSNYQQASTALTTSTSFGGDVSGTYNAIVVANDSHTHAFNNLTGKTSGTGNYQTTGDMIADNFEATGLGPNSTPGTDDLYIGGYGILGDRTGTIYVSNVSGAVSLNHTGVHNVNTKLVTTATGVTVTGTMAATTVTGANVTSGSDPGHTHTAYLTSAVTSVAAGNGMNFTTITGTGSVTMGTPGSLSGSTTNAVTATSHTHAISSITAAKILAGSLATGVNSYFTASTGNSAYKIPFMNYTGTASTNASMLHDSGATFTYNPSTNTLTVSNINMADGTLDQPVLQDYAIESVSYTPTGTTQTLTYSNGPAFEVDLESVTGTTTITLSGGPPTGTYGQITVKITQDSTTARAVNWSGGVFEWAGGTEKEVTTTLNGFTIFTFETWDGGTTWFGGGADYA